MKAFTTSWKTTICGICALAVAVGTCVGAMLDDDPSTVADWNTVAVALLALFTGLQGFVSRDADKSSQDAGVRQ